MTSVADTRRATTTTHVTEQELQDIPSSRDPWVVMQTVPTVYMDRVNVGGAESGQQSNYNAKGAQATDNTWSIDGVPVTDMGDNIVRPEHATGLVGVLLRLRQLPGDGHHDGRRRRQESRRPAFSSTWC